MLWYTLYAKGIDLGEQRALQDWYVKLGLQTVPGVSEVASFGGFEKQYQVTVDPHKLNYYNIPLAQVLKAVKSNNNDVSGRKFEMNGTGYIKSLTNVENISIGAINTIPIKIKDIATVQMGGDERLGIFDENGTGEVVGGIVVMRYEENADKCTRRTDTLRSGQKPNSKNATVSNTLVQAFYLYFAVKITPKDTYYL